MQIDIHPCEDLAEAIMDRSGAGGVIVIMLRQGGPTDTIALLPGNPDAVRAAGKVLRDLARTIEFRADNWCQPEGQA